MHICIFGQVRRLCGGLVIVVNVELNCIVATILWTNLVYMCVPRPVSAFCSGLIAIDYAFKGINIFMCDMVSTFGC